MVAGLVALSLVGLLLAKIFGGSMATIAGPDSPAIARIHAEAAGRSLAFRIQEVSTALTERGNAESAQPIVEVVRYRVQTSGSLEDIARIFDLPMELARALNPGLPDDRKFGAGKVFTVYKHGVRVPEAEPKPFRQVDVPMPDGLGRRVRSRSKSRGTARMVRDLDQALNVYGRAFPKGPVVIVSDMSLRGGGRLRPHHTHRDGRDVDLSYVPVPEHDNGGFLKMTSMVFDPERNWTMLKALVDTGGVELILMDYQIQKMYHEFAATKGVPAAELARIFQYPRDKEAEVGIIRHWDGHRDHMHVRFACPADFPECGRE